MEDLEKGASSSGDPNEKKYMIDDDIGKEFLSSWKSVSVTGNDTIDFSFDTVSSGKKKAFNFGKLDMDFSLDNDFDKISSFNVDMSDLDFSCSSKKVAKPKDQCEGELSTKNHKEKNGTFNFSFDFNVLDDFNLDSTLPKRENAPKNNLDRKIIASDESEHRDSTIGLDVDGRVAAFDEGQNKKVAASGRVPKSDVDTVSGCGENREVSIEKSPSKSRTFGDMVVSQTTSSSPDRISTGSMDKKDQQNLFSTKTRPAVSSETSQVSLGQSIGENDSTKDNVSNVQMEVDSLGSKLQSESVQQHSGNDGMVTDVGSDHETSELKDSDSPHVSPYVTRDECKKAETDTASKMPKENHLETESVAHDFEIEAISAAILSPSISKDCIDNRDTEDRTAKVLAAPEGEQVVEKVKLIKERESGVFRSKFFRRSEEHEPQVCQPSPVIEKASALGSQGTAALTLNSLGNGKSKNLDRGESQIGRNAIGDTKSLSRDSDKGESALLMGSEKNVKNLSSIRVGLTEYGVGNASKLPAKSRLPDKESNKVSSDMLGVTKLTKDLANFSGDNPANSTDRTTKPSCQTSENSKILVPSTGSKILSVGGSTGKKTDLSSFKLLRTSVSSKAQTDASQEFHSLKNSQKSKELPAKFVSNISHPVSKTQKKLRGITSLKRKTLEGPTGEVVPLNPHKRLSQSPRESRNPNEPVNSTVDEQPYGHCILVESNINTAYDDGATSEQELPADVNMKELEISLTMENDGNAEKAEAYAKELENICNMLKKKHEEAKETLVRAIVNNNSLLMLNHPIFDEKIRNVQKLLTKLKIN